jgi:predicted DNA-binding protein
MSTSLIVRIEEDTKKRFSRLVRIEGKSASEKVREMIDGYIRKADIGLVVDDLWARVGTKMRRKGVRERDVARAIRRVRSSR